MCVPEEHTPDDDDAGTQESDASLTELRGHADAMMDSLCDVFDIMRAATRVALAASDVVGTSEEEECDDEDSDSCGDDEAWDECPYGDENIHLCIGAEEWMELIESLSIFCDVQHAIDNKDDGSQLDAALNDILGRTSTPPRSPVTDDPDTQAQIDRFEGEGGRAI